ncbi:IS701 family transposase, partial [Nonomuraea sp. B12E4]|uniref:IS701 family transposase n=1 Tax=Nonomuraea sp. B12E4 TaxID=3153564 RepID=UPI00325F3914
RKNSETIAEYAGERCPSALQRFVSLTPWDADELRDDVRAYALKHLADERGILIGDPTGFAKKGPKSAGVQRQYSGTLGRIDNCQIGVFLAYANRSGDRVLIDRELYLPEKSWCADMDRRREARIPDEVGFATRPQQVQAMIERTVAAGVPFAWFTADEEFGQNPGLRAFLQERDIAYCMAVPKTTDVTTGSITTAAGCRTRIEDIAAGLKPSAWSRRACGIGTKGFRVYDWAMVDRGDGHQYVMRRNVSDGELAYFHCYNPRGEGASELVAVIGLRWPIEECFEAAKQEAGLDQYQFRLYHAWYRHVTLAMLALAFLAIVRHTEKKGAHCLWTTSGDSGRRSGEPA